MDNIAVPPVSLGRASASDTIETGVGDYTHVTGTARSRSLCALSYHQFPSWAKGSTEVRYKPPGKFVT